jgi:polyisoprenoid-binding protein YceI
MQRPSTLLALWGILCAAGPAPAADARPQDRPVPAAQSFTATGGHVEFTAVGWPSALTIHGKGDGIEGRLAVLGPSVSGALSFDLSGLSTGIGLRDRHMKEKYLEVAQHPRATLALTGVSLASLPVGDRFDPVRVPWDGMLTLHGVTRRVAGEARIGRAGNAVKTVAEFTVDIGEFGIEVPSYMGITVAEKVEVKVSLTGGLEAARDPAPQ